MIELVSEGGLSKDGLYGADIRDLLACLQHILAFIHALSTGAQPTEMPPNSCLDSSPGTLDIPFIPLLVL